MCVVSQRARHQMTDNQAGQKRMAEDRIKERDSDKEKKSKNKE